jgi:preprotein translocase subunit SecF
MQFFQQTNIDFLSKRKMFYLISGILIIIGLGAFFAKGLVIGIDFAGGTEVLVRFQNDVAINEIRSSMEQDGVAGAEIKTMGNERDILIRTAEQGEGTTVSDKIKEGLKKSFPNNNFEVLRIDKVGPKIGKELRISAIYATLFSLLGILIYLAFRFEFVYALGSVLALLHDVLMTLGIVAIFSAIFPSLNLELNQGMVAAFLTLIGFSVNDTVVVFDRIRENIKLFKNEKIQGVMNRSLNYTLNRTIITNGTVFITVLILLIFGGEVNRSFAFTFLIGIITGTYSSIYVAGAFVVDIKNMRDKKGIKPSGRVAISKA